MNDNARSNNPMYKVNMEVTHPNFFTQLRKTGIYGITIVGDFDLNGSKEFLLEVTPGSANNSLVFKQTTTDQVNNQTFQAELGMTDDLTWKNITTGDITYAPETFSGMGHTYLRKNMVYGKNILTQSMFTTPNTVYHIVHDFILESLIVMPSDCTLCFEGGSIEMINLDVYGIHINEYGFTFNNTRIDADMYQIFKVGDMLNIGVMNGPMYYYSCNGFFSSAINGTMNNRYIYPQWFGAKGDYISSGQPGTDDSSAFQYALNTSSSTHVPVYVPAADYKISNTIYLPAFFKMQGDAFAWAEGGSRLHQYCRYLFRPKAYDNNDAGAGGFIDEQSRLRNFITCTIDSISIIQAYWSEPASPLTGTSAARNEVKAFGDPYYIRKTYVFYGGQFDGCLFTKIRTNNIGTFLYGSWRGCSDMHDCFITCYRDFMSMNIYGEFTADDEAKYATSSCQSKTELGSTTTTTYGGVSYLGYQEEIEGFKTIDGVVQETLMDSIIKDNYINCGKLRGCLFSKVNATVSHISGNFIDFFYCLFYEPFNMANMDFSGNTIDYAIVFYKGNLHGLLCHDNIFIKVRYADCCTNQLLVWPWNDVYVEGQISSDIPSRAGVKTGVVFNPYYGWNGVQNVLVVNNKFYKCDNFWKSTDEYTQRSFNLLIRDNLLEDVVYPWDTVYNKGFKKYIGATAITNDLQDIHIQFLERLEVAGIANAPSARTYADTSDGTTGVVINKDTVVLDTLTGKEWHSFNNAWHDAMGNVQP